MAFAQSDSFLGRPIILFSCFKLIKSQYSIRYYIKSISSTESEFLHLYFVFLDIANRFYMYFLTEIYTKMYLVSKIAPNRVYEKRPKAKPSKAYKNASKKIKKKFFFIMRIISKYCILLCKEWNRYYI